VATPSQYVDGWTTITWPGWFRICVPPDWQTEAYATGDPDTHLHISGEVSGDIIELFIYVSPLAMSTFYSGIRPTNQRFFFDDGSVGYMLENDWVVHWDHTDGGISHIFLQQDHNPYLFADNEELVLRIIRTFQNIGDFSYIWEDWQSEFPFEGSINLEMMIRWHPIEDWIRHIPLPDVAFRVIPEGATGYVILDIRSNDRMLAQLIIEDWDLFEELSESQGFQTDSLPPAFLERQIDAVRYLDFEGMGIVFWLNGIKKGTPVHEARRMFLDTDPDGNVMYTREDVDPGSIFEGDALFIGGEYRPGGASSIPHGYLRELYYEHTILRYEGFYTVYCTRTFILFPIDENGNVVNLIFGDLTHRN